MVLFVVKLLFVVCFNYIVSIFSIHSDDRCYPCNTKQVWLLHMERRVKLRRTIDTISTGQHIMSATQATVKYNMVTMGMSMYTWTFEGANISFKETGAVFTFGKSRFAENKPSHFFIKNDPVIHVACGDEHTAVICKNGRIFAFGSNEWGQLGLGHNNMVHKPSCIKALKPEKAKFIACGRAHTIILTESNNIYACGSNTDGQLGLENVDMLNMPTKLQHPQLKENGTIKKLSAGSQHSAALTESGLVFVWGSNSEGQLGIESNRTNCKVPTLLEFKDKIRDISCGYYHTAVLTENGDLYTFGENENGKLGHSQGEGQTYKPTQVHNSTPFESIACGGRHNMALTAAGEAFAFGSNTNGELGFDKDVTWVTEPKLLSPELFAGERLKAISCGDNHTAFITESYKIYSCGDTRHGKLCQDEILDEGQFLPEQIARFANYKITHVACGGCHTIICAQKIIDEPNSLLPPLQRIPNSILNPEIKTEAAVEIQNGLSDMTNGIDSQKTMMNGIAHDAKEMAENGITELGTMTEEVMKNGADNLKSITEDINKLPTEISEIIKSQKEQLDAEYDKTINTIKNESNIMSNKVMAEANDTKDNMINNAKNFLHNRADDVNEITGLKSLKDNLTSGSVDNLLQEIEDDLSNKSSKTYTSDTISVKSNGKHADEIEDITLEKAQNGENDEEDLKTEVPIQASERKFSKIFGTFKRKKISSSSATEVKTIESTNIEQENGDEIKKDEEIPSKTDKTKTCTIL